MEWIRVKDRLPPADISVFGVDERNIIERIYLKVSNDITEFEYDGCYGCNRFRINLNNITHWMHFPALPKDE